MQQRISRKFYARENTAKVTIQNQKISIPKFRSQKISIPKFRSNDMNLENVPLEYTAPIIDNTSFRTIVELVPLRDMAEQLSVH